MAGDLGRRRRDGPGLVECWGRSAESEGQEPKPRHYFVLRTKDYVHTYIRRQGMRLATGSRAESPPELLPLRQSRGQRPRGPAGSPTIRGAGGNTDPDKLPDWEDSGRVCSFIETLVMQAARRNASSVEHFSLPTLRPLAPPCWPANAGGRASVAMRDRPRTCVTSHCELVQESGNERPLAGAGTDLCRHGAIFWCEVLCASRFALSASHARAAPLCSSLGLLCSLPIACQNSIPRGAIGAGWIVPGPPQPVRRQTSKLMQPMSIPGEQRR